MSETQEEEKEIFDIMKKYNFFDNYLMKFNKALLQKMACESENNDLKKQNNYLKDKLKQFLANLTISEETLKTNDNNLFIVKSNLSLNSTSNSINTCTIDGVEEIRKRIVHLCKD